MSTDTPQTPAAFLAAFKPEYSFQRQEGWLKLCELLAATDANPADWEARIAAVWTDEDRIVPGPWLEAVFAGSPPSLLPLTRTIAFGAAETYKESHGNRLLPLEVSHIQALSESPLLSGITGIVMEARSYQIRAEHVEILAKSPHITDIRLFRALHFSGRIEAAGAEAIAASKNFSNLEVLDLYYNDIEDRGLIALLNSDNLKNLRVLKVERDKIRAAGIKALAGCARLKNLEHLSLSWCNLSSGAFVSLAKSPHLRKLKTLTLNFNKPGSKGATALAKSPILATVESLDLSACNIDNEGMIALANSPHLGQIRKVIFGNNDWGAPGAVALASAASLGPNLEELDLYAVEVGGTGGVALARSTCFPKLQKVRLRAYDPTLDVAACDSLLAWDPLDDSEKSTVRSRREKLLELAAVRERLREVDISKIQAKLNKAAAMEPGEESWKQVRFFLDEAFRKNPAVTDEQVIDEVAALLASWPDALRTPDYQWFSRLKDSGEVLPMLRLVRTISGADSHSIQSIASCAELCSLVCLRIYGGSIAMKEDDAAALAGATHLAGLHTLDLTYLKNLNKGAALLAGAAWLSGLRTLHLDRNGLSRGGLKSLLKSPHLTGLEHLSIVDNRIGDGGVADLAKTAAMASLKTLTLTRTNLTDKSAAAIAASPHLAGLTALSIDGLSSTGRAILAASPHLSAAVTAAFKD